MKNWKKRLLIFSELLIVLFFASNNESHACGPSYDEYDRMYRFFNPEVINSDEYKPFYFSIFDTYTSLILDPDSNREDNLKDWDAFLVPISDHYLINDLLYTDEIDLLKQISLYVDSEIYNAPYYKNNALIEKWKKDKNTEVINYIIYAKSCEPFCISTSDRWEEKENMDPIKLNVLVNEGLAAYNKTTTSFIKLRYAYQIVRLYRYSQQYDKCIETYNNLIGPLKTNSTIKYWAMEQMAGAFLKIKQYAKAAYYFSMVFNNDKNKRASSLNSFYIPNDSVWNECVNLCQNKKERSSLYFMRGINYNSNALEEMKEIYSLNESSKELQLLLVREISKLELYIPLTQIDSSYNLGQSLLQKEENMEYLENLRVFIEKCVSEGKISNKQIWQLSLAYLFTLQENFKQSNIVLNTIGKQFYVDLKFKKQAQIISIINQANLLDKPDEKAMNNIMVQYKQIWKNKTDIPSEFYTQSNYRHSLLEYILSVFSKIYTHYGNAEMALICTGRYGQLYCRPTIESINCFEALVQKDQKNSYDSLLLQSFWNNNFWWGTNDIWIEWNVTKEWQSNEQNYKNSITNFWSNYKILESYLKELRGTVYLGEGNLTNALNEFSTVNYSNINRNTDFPYGEYYNHFNLDIDPFKGYINDLNDTIDWHVSNSNYTKYTYTKELKKLLDLEISSSSEKEKAITCFKIGNAYYNSSLFGKAHHILYQYRFRNYDSYLYKEITLQNNGFIKQRGIRIYDCYFKANEYYKKALAFANSSGNKELAAKCCFMLAKCEQNDFYMSDISKNIKYNYSSNVSSFSQEEIVKETSGYRSNFKLLKEKYSDTQFYKEAIKECKYFEYYVSR